MQKHFQHLSELKFICHYHNRIYIAPHARILAIQRQTLATVVRLDLTFVKEKRQLALRNRVHKRVRLRVIQA